MDQQYNQYAESINASFASVKALLSKLEEVASSNGADIADATLVEMNSAQRVIILENVQLIRKKNELKGAYNKIANTLREKIKNIDQLNNKSILHLNSAGYNNGKLYSHRNEQLEKLENLPSVILNEKSDMEWLNHLNVSRHDLLDPMQTENGIFTIEDADIQRLQESLYKEKVNRFRLKLIDEKILHRQRSTVSSIEVKWDDRLNHLNCFIAKHVKEVLNEIDGITGGMEDDNFGSSEIDEEEEDEEEDEEAEDDDEEEEEDDDEEGEVEKGGGEKKKEQKEQMMKKKRKPIKKYIKNK
ncbi:BA75_03418T0 [Komagataella pastoris]|uniref:BA75_03418T0 n=1 Tax=Komagataella pastoris TaxID=4922 RepID=A0A1B2JFP0_PICPA|nr:BA75_03418T0 [Komagataella pastoris]